MVPRSLALTREQFALAHPIRQRLLAEIRRQPGLRMHELAGLIGQADSSLKWHMQMLVRARLIVVHRFGQMRFYTVPGLLPDAVRLAGLSGELRMYRRREALAFLASRPSTTPTELALEWGGSNGAARNALDFLVANGLATCQRSGQAYTYHVTGLGRRIAGRH